MLITPLLAALGYGYILRFVSRETATVLEARRKRNAYLPTVVQQIASEAVSPISPGDMELQPEELGQLRYFIEVGYQEKNDW